MPAPQGAVGSDPQKAATGISPTEFLLPNREKAPPKLCSNAAILHTLENDLTPSALFPQQIFSEISKYAGLCGYRPECLLLPHFSSLPKIIIAEVTNQWSVGQIQPTDLLGLTTSVVLKKKAEPHFFLFF